MRWVVLTLSLGAAIVSTLHGIFEILVSSTADGAFTWVMAALLIGSALFALAGGVVAFHWRRAGGVFLTISALMCFLAHRDAVVYAGFYLAGAALCVFIRAPEDYDREDNEVPDEDYPESNDDDAEDNRYLQERNQSFSAQNAKKRARAAAIREEYDLARRGARLGQPVRTRSSKVCPACGASVGIDHKFCFTCGCPLHTPSPESPDEPEAVMIEKRPPLPHDEDDAPKQETDGLRDFRNRDFQKIRFSGHPEEDETHEDNTPSPPSNGEETERARGGGREERGGRASAAPESRKTPHRVFVTPMEDDQPVRIRPLMIDPDDSYQEFSAYTRRRKRKKRSVLRRAVGPLLLLLALVGAGWFLLGLQKLPPEALPVQPPVRDLAPPASSEPPVAEPVPARSALDSLRIDVPSRGVVVGTNVNVRPDHSTAGAVVMKVNSNTKVELLDYWEGMSGSLTGPWYRIRANGKEGWIYGQYFQPLDARDATLPPGYITELLVTFGADRAALTGQLGQPGSQSATTLSWSGLTVNLRNGDITRLQLTSAKHVLKNGVAVGITDDQLFKAVGYPSEYRSGQLRYVESGSVGMSVSLKNRRVENITVGNI